MGEALSTTNRKNAPRLRREGPAGTPLATHRSPAVAINCSSINKSDANQIGVRIKRSDL
jgi:hypothetical protein